MDPSTVLALEGLGVGILLTILAFISFWVIFVAIIAAGFIIVLLLTIICDVINLATTRG